MFFAWYINEREVCVTVLCNVKIYRYGGKEF